MNFRIKSLLTTFSIFICFSCTDRDPNYGNIDGKFNDPVNLEGGCEGTAYPNWENSDYVLPFPIGQTYTVNLSHCTSSYHAPGEPDQFAIDFDMEIGTEISSSRRGEVVYVEERGSDYGNPNNVIIVDHFDNTFAIYAHLTKNGAFVEVGEIVVMGQVIGLSGATGLAGYPHLHFIVTQNGWEYPYIGLPINFKNTKANPFSLISGESYTAFLY